MKYLEYLVAVAIFAIWLGAVEFALILFFDWRKRKRKRKRRKR